MLEIQLLYWPAELDVPATFAAQVGAIQAVGSSPSEALKALGEKLDRFPRPLVGAPAPIWEA
jgi:hypothetical protein